MQVLFWVDSNNGTGKGCHEKKFDTLKDFGMDDEEWADLSDDSKQSYVDHWVDQTISSGWLEAK